MLDIKAEPSTWGSQPTFTLEILIKTMRSGVPSKRPEFEAWIHSLTEEQPWASHCIFFRKDTVSSYDKEDMKNTDYPQFLTMETKSAEVSG